MPKDIKKLLLAYAPILIFGVLGVVIFLVISASIRSARQPVGVSCSRVGVNHSVVINDDKLDQPIIHGVLCDTLTITNQDDRIRLIAFGTHDHHVPYDGVTEQYLTHDQSLTVVFDQPGHFIFHDHLNDAVKGTFYVAARP